MARVIAELQFSSHDISRVVVPLLQERTTLIEAESFMQRTCSSATMVRFERAEGGIPIYVRGTCIESFYLIEEE